jgi:hypothetical protein
MPCKQGIQNKYSCIRRELNSKYVCMPHSNNNTGALNTLVRSTDETLIHSMLDGNAIILYCQTGNARVFMTLIVHLGDDLVGKQACMITGEEVMSDVAAGDETAAYVH